MLELTMDVLPAAGYRQYEISNYARPGFESRHNLIYWRNGPYIGVGPAAAGCYGGRRYKNVRDVEAYVRLMDERDCAEVESEAIDVPTLMIEMVMMQLRLVEGLSIAAFQERTGVDPIALFSPTLEGLTDQGLVRVTDSHIALTRRGLLVADAVIRELACLCDDPQAA